jgi:hypothetical protein
MSRVPKLLLGAVALAAAGASLHAARKAPIGDSAWPAPSAASGDRRRSARPGLRAPVEVPLVRVSRVHVAVKANAFARREGGPEVGSVATVLLDTGSSVPLATVDGQDRFALEVGIDPPLVSRGFSGHPSKLFAVAADQSLDLSLDARSAPDGVLFTVRHLSPNRLYGADVIAPPQLLAPRGGAVSLGLADGRFAVCESVEECEGRESELVPSSVRICDDRPELVVVDVDLGGAKETMLLDTGAATLVFRDVFERARLQERVQSKRSGTLLGAGSATIGADVVTGDFAWRIGAGARVPRSPKSFWVVSVPEDRRPARCATAGSIGTDALEDCKVVIADGTPARAALTCKSGASGGLGTE